MTRDEWIEALARELGADSPTAQDVDAILALAAEAAHGSERTAAPIATWLAGASGRPLREVQELAARIGD